MGRWLVALAVLMPLLLAGPPAYAKHRCSGKEDAGFASVEGYVGVLKLPQMAVNGSDTPHRLLGLPTPSVLQPMLGGGVDFAIRCDNLVFNLTSITYATTTGTASLGSVADGAAATTSIGPLQIVDIALPLFSGFQAFVDKDWKLGLKIDAGVEVVWGSATVSGRSVAPTGASLTSTTAFVRAQLSACGRMGKAAKQPSTTWLCLTVNPIIYDGAAMPGASLGLRVDL